MFYEFVDDKHLDFIWDAIKKKIEIENTCWKWIGKYDNKKKPILYIRYEKKRYNYCPKRLSYQKKFNGESVSRVQIIFQSICNKNDCINPEHLIIINRKEEWDPQIAKKKLEKNGKRLDPTDGQEIGCLIWSKCLDSQGYGCVSLFGKVNKVHVFSILSKLNLQSLPKGLVTRHLCKNKACFEQEHLTLGTYQDNSDDTITDLTRKQGNSSATATITEDIAKAIKLSRKPFNDPDYMTQSKRALIFNVSRGIVANIDAGLCWKWLPAPKDIEKRKSPSNKIKNTFDKDNLSLEIYNILHKRILKKTIEVNAPKNFISNCLIWQGQINSNSYGVIKYGGIVFRIHIIICHISSNYKKKNDNQIVRHLCGNKRCVQLDHLAYGSYSENRIDEITLNKKTNCKLNINSVKDIRENLKNRKDINNYADKYQVTHLTIARVLDNKSWKFI